MTPSRRRQVLALHEATCPQHGDRGRCQCPAYPRAAQIEGKWGRSHPLFRQMLKIDRQAVVDHAILTASGNPLAGLVAGFDAERAGIDASRQS